MKYRRPPADYAFSFSRSCMLALRSNEDRVRSFTRQWSDLPPAPLVHDVAAKSRRIEGVTGRASHPHPQTRSRSRSRDATETTPPRPLVLTSMFRAYSAAPRPRCRRRRPQLQARRPGCRRRPRATLLARSCAGGQPLRVEGADEVGVKGVDEVLADGKGSGERASILSPDRLFGLAQARLRHLAVLRTRAAASDAKLQLDRGDLEIEVGVVR